MAEPVNGVPFLDLLTDTNTYHSNGWESAILSSRVDDGGEKWLANLHETESISKSLFTARFSMFAVVLAEQIYRCNEIVTKNGRVVQTQLLIQLGNRCQSGVYFVKERLTIGRRYRYFTLSKYKSFADSIFEAYLCEPPLFK